MAKKKETDNDSNMLIVTKTKKDKGVEEKEKAKAKSKPKKLSKKERKLLEKVIEKKDKAKRRNELLEQLSALQVKSQELNLYKSVKDIGKKESKSKLRAAEGNTVTQPDDDDDEKGQTRPKFNSVAGSNKRKLAQSKNDEKESDNESINTDDMSSDSDEEAFQKYKEEYERQKEAKAAATLAESIKKLQEMNRNAELQDDMDAEYKARGGADAVAKPNGTSWKTRYVHVERREEIKESRLKLPILSEEQYVMETINDNDIVIICGETGSGKTTQVPQFLYEAGYAEDGKMIGITEPRRVAAISMSKRVADEMSLSSEQCSFQIRYEGNYSPETRIKFMTDGVLLKEVQMDFLLTKYSAIIIDEAHERSVFTDILIGLLSRVVPLRNKRGNPLKLIIMSATLRVEDFTSNLRLFKQTPPVINIESRQFPVSIHFNKHTYEDYLAEAFRKVYKIHRQLPEGGILVFVTGQQEVNILCAKLRRAFPYFSGREQTAKPGAQENGQAQEANAKGKKSKKKQKTDENAAPMSENEPPKPFTQVDLDSYSTMPLDEEVDMLDSKGQSKSSDLKDDEELANLDSDSDDDDFFDESTRTALRSGNADAKIIADKNAKPLYVLPLYALLSSEKQAKVFDKVPDGCRLCVVATNIAETSLTIPNIKYVVDTGKIKTKFNDKTTGVSTFKICWTSKASADQRAGRAGRTSAGHCYRLFSSAVYNDEFPQFSEPEITRKPVEDLVLQMKDIGIDRIHNFPFPTPPDSEAIKASENLLIKLGALERDKTRTRNLKDEQITKITDLGKMMVCFPVNPRFSKMLALALQQDQKNKDLISYVICLICGLSVHELFIDGETSLSEDKKPENEGQKETAAAEGSKHVRASDAPKEEKIVKFSDMRKSWLNSHSSSNIKLLGDLMVYLVALGAVEYGEFNSNVPGEEGLFLKFCEKYGIRHKAIIEARKLRIQLTNTVNLVFPDADLHIDPKMAPPNDENARLLRQIVLSGMVDKIAKKYEQPFVAKDGRQLKNAYQSLLLEDPVFIHPSSVLFKDLPEYVCYTELSETTKIYMRAVCAIESKWLPMYLANQCSFDKPITLELGDESDLQHQQPRYDARRGVVLCHRRSTFSSVMWPVQPVEVEFPLCLDLYKWFARFLLEGKVFEPLKTYASVMLASPSIILKPWAKLQPRTEAIVNALVKNKCSNKQKLCEILATNKDYLLSEYLMWVPESIHFEVKLKWASLTSSS